MILQDLLKHIPKTVAKEDFDRLKEIEDFEIYRKKNNIGGCSELYTEARKFAFEFLKGLDFLDKELCREHNLDYLDVLCDSNLIKIMTAYRNMEEERIYEIYMKIYGKRI
ncbi:MAG: hypothetical protein QT11_C0001G0913 [archaeon GW2011_AR20]|nr:MAG: hypothetical protein QT11_C0001G0913 [archaeon GW2011_AR20]MBS3160138.1 hypothetical protein [Candidatus Woesearchaeota archaeon]